MGRHHNMQLVFFVTLIFCCEVALSHILDFFTTKIEISPNSTIKCKNILECADCTTRRICGDLNGELVQFFISNCDGDTPYCKNGSCSKTPDVRCSPVPLCPFDGILPDPTDCTRYIRCANQTATVNQCPRNNVYNHATGTCVLRHRLSDCVNFNCYGSQQGKIVVYPRDNRLYALCTDSGPAIIGKCKDYQKFDQTLEKCVRYCAQTGTQPPDDPDSKDSCGKYYQCAEIYSGIYQPAEMWCACNEGYNETIKNCSTEAACLKGKTRCTTTLNLSKKSDNNNDASGNENAKDNSANDNDNSDTSDSNNVANKQPDALIINNSGNDNSNNSVSNGNDDVDGNIVNGNKNGDNSESGNVANNRPAPVPLIINNSGDKNNNNKVSNGNDSADGNLVNGNNNGDNSNSGNVAKGNPARLSPLIINNSGNDNENNKVSNSDDNVDGNLVNGNDNGDNSKSGNVQRRSVSPLIINSSGNDDSNNNVSNGNDDVDGNVVNGNKNGDNKNSGNVKNDPSPAPPPDNSENKDNQRNNDSEKDGSGDVNDNNNPDKSQPIKDPKEPSETEIKNFLTIIIQFIIRTFFDQQV